MAEYTLTFIVSDSNAKQLRDANNWYTPVSAGKIEVNLNVVLSVPVIPDEFDIGTPFLSQR